MKKCKNCGAENLDTAQYCKECGAPLSLSQKLNAVTFKRTFRKLHPVANISLYVIAVAIPLFVICLILANYFDAKSENVKDEYEKKFKSAIAAVKRVDGISASKLDTMKNDLYNRNNFREIYDDDERKLIDQISVKESYELQKLEDRYSNYSDLIYDYFDIYSGGEITIIFLFASIAGLLALLYFFIAFNLGWNKFRLQQPFPKAKEAAMQYAFSRNTRVESFRIKENSRGELMLHDKGNGKRAYIHLIQDENGRTEIIGEKFNTMELIRSIFGKEINFIEN